MSRKRFTMEQVIGLLWEVDEKRKRGEEKRDVVENVHLFSLSLTYLISNFSKF